jgi:hypothetical protein
LACGDGQKAPQGRERGAAARFDTRRQLIVEETNAIGTAYVRLDLLPADAQPTLWERVRQYLAARLAVYRKLPDVAAAQEALARSVQLQGEIWTRLSRRLACRTCILMPPSYCSPR